MASSTNLLHSCGIEPPCSPPHRCKQTSLSHFHRNMWYFRGTQRNKWKPQEQLPILLNVIPDTGNGRDGKRSDLSMVRWLCNFNNICNSERQWVIISSTISPTLTNPGPYFMLGPKETLSKRGKRTLCKVSYSKFFPQVRKKHYLILEVYMHLGSSLIALKKKKLQFHNIEHNKPV